MKDTQNEIAEIALPIDNVGVRNISMPIIVSDRANSKQHTVAMIDMGVDLPAKFKGTHMSRFLAVLESWTEELSYESLKKLLDRMLDSLDAQKATITFKFTYFIKKTSPVSNSSCLQGYECYLTGSAARGCKVDFILGVTVPVMTVCPCSKAISSEGAHSQRSDIRLKLKLKSFNWLEEFIDIAENSGSSKTYPLVKRADEKFITESAFANPCFVEDVVRNISLALIKHEAVAWFKVEVESYESIHSHNAFAVIEHTNS